MKILLFDLETFGMDFRADAGFILCASYQWFGSEKIYTIHNFNSKEVWNDKIICKKMKEVIEEADMIVTWNGKDFDVRFLQTRMLKHRLGYLPPIPHEDGVLTARRTLKMGRSLENVGNFFELHEKKHKLSIDVWIKAALGEKISKNLLVERCESDVRLLNEAYKLIGPLSKVHPNVNLMDKDTSGCPFCGSKNIYKKGSLMALRHYRIRYHCQQCGKWSTSHPIRK